MKPDDWFSIRKVEKGIYLIKEPNYKEHANIYLVKGKKCDLLIDTGLGISSLKSFVEKTSKKFIVVNTHTHFDHGGGNFEFKKILVHSYEANTVSNPTVDKTLSHFLNAADFKELPNGFDPKKYKIKPSKPKIISDGDFIDLESKKVEIIHTPGHSPGSICLFDKHTSNIFTGDTIYKGKIFFNLPDSNIADYGNSLQKLLKLKVKTAFTGHNEILNGKEFYKMIKAIINEIKASSAFQP